jgi:hypothetical protein
MKKILTLSLVLFSTVMFANGTDDDKKATASTSGAAVIKNGESSFRVIYKSETESDVKVSIRNDKDELVYSEKVNNTEGFTRPYNFESLGEGDYTIAIEDGTKKQIEKVSYRVAKVTKALNVLKMSNDGKFLVMAAGQGNEEITISIYDGQNNLVHKSFEITNGNFSKLFNLKSFKGRHLTFEIANENGEVKTVAY